MPFLQNGFEKRNIHIVPASCSSKAIYCPCNEIYIWTPIQSVNDRHIPTIYSIIYHNIVGVLIHIKYAEVSSWVGSVPFLLHLLLAWHNVGIFKQSLYLPRNTTFRPSSGLSQEDQFNSISTFWNKVLKYISKLHWRLNFLRYYFLLLSLMSFDLLEKGHLMAETSCSLANKVIV